MTLRNILLISLWLGFIQAHGQSAESNYSLVRENMDHAGYFEHLPDAYGNNTDTKYPLILFLHGLGERDSGKPDDLKNLLKWGPPRVISANQPTYSAIHPYRFIVLAPQLKSPKSSWPAEEVHAFLNYALENYQIDENRIYLTGISMGGNGAWNYAYSELNFPNRIAAMAPIAAWGDPRKGCAIVERNIPVWAFHGLNDKVIPISRGEVMFRSLQDCGQQLDTRKYRFSPVNAEHTAWPPIYRAVTDSLSIYDWFLQFTLSKNDTGEVKTHTSWSPPPFVQATAKPYGALPAKLNESSGLVIDRAGGLWSVNDSGNEATLYQIDTTLALLKSVPLTAGPNVDWEDLAVDSQGNVYIADIGNNLNVRRKLFIYKVPEEELSRDIARAETISFVYEDQRDFPPGQKNMHYDAESLIHYEGNLYIFSKNRTDPFTGYTHIYRIPDAPGDYVAELVDSLKLGEGVMTNFWLTAADISPSGKHIALLSHDKLWILSCFQGKKFSQGLLTEVRLNSFTQKEGMAFLNDNALILSDERIRNILGGNLYRLDLPPETIKSCE